MTYLSIFDMFCSPRRLTFYVKDFLSASHTDHKPIVIDFMEMTADNLWTPDPKCKTGESIDRSLRVKGISL